MPNYNRVTIIGHLTRDPELKYLQNNTPIVNCGIGVTEKYKDKEDTCFVDFAIFGKGAEIFNQYMNKGSAVLLDGSLKLETWQDQGGSKRSKHTLKVRDFTFLGGKDGGGAKKPKPQQQQTQPAGPSDDDIPF